MKARHRRLVIGAMIGSLPPVANAEPRPSQPPALPAAHHVVLADPEQAQARNAPVYRFSIPSGPLAAALQQFELVTGLHVRVAADLVANMTTLGVSGTLTADQALARLLDGTSLSHRFADQTTVDVEVHVAAETVNVTGGHRVESAKYSAP